MVSKIFTEEKKLLKPGCKLIRHFLTYLFQQLAISINDKRFFLPYTFRDLLCGKLICAWPHKRMISRVNLSVIYSHVQDDICVSTYLPIKPPENLPWSTSPYTSADSRDETFVQDGTICGPDMVI